MGRRERKAAMRSYVTGLLLDGNRKSVEPVKLDGELPGIRALVVDDTGFPKKGGALSRSRAPVLWNARSDRQLPSATSLHAAGEGVSGCIGLTLYLPKEWTEDRERRWIPGRRRVSRRPHDARPPIRRRESAERLSYGLPKAIRASCPARLDSRGPPRNRYRDDAHPPTRLPSPRHFMRRRSRLPQGPAGPLPLSPGGPCAGLYRWYAERFSSCSSGAWGAARSRGSGDSFFKLRF